MIAVTKVIALSILVAGIALSAPAVAQHAHPVPVPTPSSHSAPPIRWTTDAPLRAGMRGARDVVVALEHARHGHLDAGQVRRLAVQLEGHVQDIFAKCKLEPRADAALHDILLPLLVGARALAADPADLRPVASMQRALDAYARGFDDPRLQPR